MKHIPNRRQHLRNLFQELQQLPHYLQLPNDVSIERSQEIARKFGESLEDLKKEYDYANQCGKAQVTRGDHIGEYPNADRLFFGYVYDLHYEAACEDEECRRRGDFED